MSQQACQDSSQEAQRISDEFQQARHAVESFKSTLERRVESHSSDFSAIFDRELYNMVRGSIDHLSTGHIKSVDQRILFYPCKRCLFYVWRLDSLKRYVPPVSILL